MLSSLGVIYNERCKRCLLAKNIKFLLEFFTWSPDSYFEIKLDKLIVFIVMDTDLSLTSVFL